MSHKFDVVWTTPTLIKSYEGEEPMGIVKSVIQVDATPSKLIALVYITSPEHVYLALWTPETCPDNVCVGHMRLRDWLKDVTTIVSSAIPAIMISASIYKQLSPPIDPLTYILCQYCHGDTAEADIQPNYPDVAQCVRDLVHIKPPVIMDDFAAFLKTIEIQLSSLHETCVHGHTFDLIARLDDALEHKQPYLTCGHDGCDQQYPLSAVGMMTSDERVHTRLSSLSSLDTTAGTSADLMPSGNSSMDMDISLFA